MFYFRFMATTPYCGTDHEEYVKFEDRPTEDDLDDIAEDICRNNAESFEYLLTDGAVQILMNCLKKNSKKLLTIITQILLAHGKRL